MMNDSSQSQERPVNSIYYSLKEAVNLKIQRYPKQQMKNPFFPSSMNIINQKTYVSAAQE